MGKMDDLPLPEFDDPPGDPVALLCAWLDGAQARGIALPNAAALATVGADGRPSNRTVLVQHVTADGLVFGTHTVSRKGRDLAARPYAAATFFWRETLQQIHVAGPVYPLPAPESDALFAERAPVARAMAAASRQSEPMPDESALRTRAAELAAAGPVARPDTWAGYRIAYQTIEFWHDRPDRLHRRLRYDRTEDSWTSVRLQP
ncbi:phenazine biosynthesis FMN-dependent oxidase PhzG [Dactylosporangium darangshiense]|uniref:Phenazine biosynthesis FMN-dependent oxidase PhzG n=2 Tax=Dactylosporangium darangshiense TaxID=579108 RepID=A0ABP8DNF4_9ACTN